MGLLKRLHRITLGRISTFLDRVEDPEVLFPQLIKEMEEQLAAATTEEASALAAVRRTELDVSRCTEKINDLGHGAGLALKADDEATAREALTAQIEAEKTLTMMTNNLEALQSTLDLATAARQQIQQQLNELRAKKHEILTRAKVAKARQNIQRTVSGSIGSSDSILDAVARLEDKIEEDEAELELQASLTGDPQVNPSLAKRLDELKSDDQLEQRLAALRADIAGNADGE